MIQELYAIYIFKKALFYTCSCWIEIEMLDIGSSLVFFEQILGKLFILVGNSISQFIVHGFPNHVEVPVFAKDHWYKKPIISGTYRAITAPISHKSSIPVF